MPNRMEVAWIRAGCSGWCTFFPNTVLSVNICQLESSSVENTGCIKIMGTARALIKCLIIPTIWHTVEILCVLFVPQTFYFLCKLVYSSGLDMVKLCIRRSTIIALHQDGVSARKIARRLQLCRSVVYKMTGHLKELGTEQDRCILGRVRSITTQANVVVKTSLNLLTSPGGHLTLRTSTQWITQANRLWGRRRAQSHIAPAIWYGRLQWPPQDLHRIRWRIFWTNVKYCLYESSEDIF